MRGPVPSGSCEAHYVQGDQKLVPPSRNGKSSGTADYSIFKYNLFKNHLENFLVYNQSFTSQGLVE